MAAWVQLCTRGELPEPGALAEFEAAGRSICLANVEGRLAAIDNLCPHRQGPLGQGWLEGAAVVCPWHSWAFSTETGEADYPEGQRVGVYALRTSGEAIEIELGPDASGAVSGAAGN